MKTRPGLGRERAQQLELDVRELDGPPVELHRPPGQVDAQPVDADDRPSRRVVALSEARRSSARTRLRNSRIENGFVM